MALLELYRQLNKDYNARLGPAHPLLPVCS